jgi:hypothetical protein
VLGNEHAREQEECKSMCLLGVLDAGGELLYSPQLVTCLSLTRGLCWMKEYHYCFTDKMLQDVKEPNEASWKLDREF